MRMLGRRALGVLVLLAVTQSLLAGPQRGSSETVASRRMITDMVGRRVEIPAAIEKVYCTSPVGTILVYTLAPEKLAGWNYPLSSAEREYILERYRNLPVLGGWFGKGNTGNVEEILAAHPDVILSVGTTDSMSISHAERLQAQSGLPVLMMAGDLEQLGDSYEFAGRLLGMDERAARLGAYCRRTISDARTAADSVVPEKRVRVYYAEGPRGLETDPAGSYHTEILDLVGAINVAAPWGPVNRDRVTVSLEQLIAWNPDVIVVGYVNGQKASLSVDRLSVDRAWGNLSAVKQGRVYVTPQLPFNWFDRPPSVNRVIGIKWLGALLYPDLFRGNLRREVREFYTLFYHVDLTDSQLDALLRSTGSCEEQVRGR